MTEKAVEIYRTAALARNRRRGRKTKVKATKSSASYILLHVVVYEANLVFTQNTACSCGVLCRCEDPPLELIAT